MACLTPFTKKNKDMNCNVSVPCGKCPDCIKRRVSGWSFRLMQEEKHSQSAHFITLTYDTEHVNITRAGFMTLSKEHIQAFFKLLRYYHTDQVNKLKYYIVGEYGGKTLRPHYHAVIYNLVDTKHVEQAWKKGQIHYGTVTGASVGYTLKYISKPGKIPLHKNDDRLPEFSLMSKRLGAQYLTDEMKAWHHADLVNRMYVNIEGGKKVAMPRYYKQKLYTDGERRQIAEHLIPEMDKRLLESLEANPDHFRDQMELHKQQFQKQATDALKRDKL